MLRKLNFTDRVKIPRAAVRIALRRQRDGELAFDPILDLSGVSALPEARVYIEAHYRTSYMRFDCGTLGDVTIPENRRLSEIDSDRVVRFRVKVVDNSANDHRIVAATDDITVSALRDADDDNADASASRISLLPVNFSDLGDVVWRVQFEPDGPVLELNHRIPNIESLARNDAQFFSLVYPAAVREILTQVLVVEQYEPTEESEDWWGLWLRWAREMTDAPIPEELDERGAWIDGVTGAFCARHRVLEKMHGGEPEDAR